MDSNASKSKKPSGASSHSKQPKTLVFFLDRSLGKNRIATALRQAGAIVQVHDDHFPQDAQDHVWLTEVGVRGWVVLTKDKRIRYRNLERNALRNAGVAAFILIAGDLNGQEMAQIFLKAMPKIVQFLKARKRPFMATIGKSAAVTLLAD